MSFFQLALRQSPAARAAPRSMLTLRMSSHSTRHGNDADVLSKEKSRNLSGTQDSSAPHKEHAPGWNEHLATDAEANVKADQAGPSGKPSKDLQDATVKQTHEHHHSLEGTRGAEHHRAKENPESTASEDFVRADQESR